MITADLENIAWTYSGQTTKIGSAHFNKQKKSFIDGAKWMREKVVDKVAELQRKAMDENGHFPTDYKEGYFDGLTDLENEL